MAMTKDDTATRNENVAALMESFPCLKFDEAFKMQNKLYCIAVRVKQMEARYCNYPDLDAERIEVRTKAYADVKKVMEKFGVECPFQLSTDSRGFGVWLFLPSERYNSMGGREAGWGY
jgi:hypothetical protein